MTTDELDRRPHRRSSPPRPAELTTEHDDFGIAIARVSDMDVVLVTGAVDAFTGRLLTRRMRDLEQARATPVLLDLTHVSFLDGGGVGAIASARRMFAQGGRGLLVVCPSGPALRLLSLLRLDVAWQVFPTRYDAMAGVLTLRPEVIPMGTPGKPRPGVPSNH